MKQENINKVWDYLKGYRMQYRITDMQNLKRAIQKNIDGDFTPHEFRDSTDSKIHLAVQKYIKHLQQDELQQHLLEKERELALLQESLQQSKPQLKHPVQHKAPLTPAKPRGGYNSASASSPLENCHVIFRSTLTGGGDQNSTPAKLSPLTPLSGTNGANKSNKSSSLDYCRVQPIEDTVSTAKPGGGLNKKICHFVKYTHNPSPEVSSAKPIIHIPPIPPIPPIAQETKLPTTPRRPRGPSPYTPASSPLTTLVEGIT